MVPIIIHKTKLLPIDSQSAAILFNTQCTRKERIHILHDHGVMVEHDTNGAPRATSPLGHWISIAHTDTLDITLLCHTRCGVDIERKDRSLDPLLRTSLMCTPQEALYRWITLEAYHKLTQIPLLSLVRSDPQHTIPFATYYISLAHHILCIMCEQPIKYLHVLGNTPSEMSLTPDMICSHIDTSITVHA